MAQPHFKHAMIQDQRRGDILGWIRYRQPTPSLPMGERWTFAFADPNHAAIVFALVATVATWVWLQARTGVWVTCAAATTALACIATLLTGSRTGMLCIALGAVIITADCWRARPKTALALAACIAMAMVVLSLQRGHPGTLLADDSILNRLHILRSLPALWSDFPDGCPAPGDVYSQWYQPVLIGEYYTNLVSGHAEFLSRSGYIGKFLYVGGWFFTLMLALTAPSARSLGLATLAVIGTSGLTVSAIVQPFFLPIMILCGVGLIAVHVLPFCGWRRLIVAASGALVMTSLSAAVLAGLSSIIVRPRPVPVVFEPSGLVVVGRPTDPLTLAIIRPSQRRCAMTYGLALRQIAAEQEVRILVVLEGSEAFPDLSFALPPLFVGSAGFAAEWFNVWRPNQEGQWALFRPSDEPPSGPEHATIYTLEGPQAPRDNDTIIDLYYRRRGYHLVPGVDFSVAVEDWLQRIRRRARSTHPDTQ